MAREIKMHETEEISERVILVAVEKEDAEISAESSLDELDELVKTAGAATVGRVIQKREKIHTGHYVGKGKLEEIKNAAEMLDATGIICDDELSPAQLKNMEEALKLKVMDRTMVILDIFAKRAISREGKIQVELAQLKYRLSRLTGIGASMSRLGGGIGTRGPGEKKLETDRRYIKERISELNEALKEIETHRNLLRKNRGKTGMPVVSLVGYTNAGKSTILNNLTNAGVLAEDKLFATLDTTTRKVMLPGGSQIFLTDTVGFIQKLPHHLIQAFRATLEELKYSDILIHVVDASNEKRSEHMEVVYKTLKDLECSETPVITVFNKMDKEIEFPLPIDNNAVKTINVSAKENLDNMLKAIEEVLKSFRKPITVLIPYKDGGLISQIYGKCEVICEEHKAEGVYFELYAVEEMKNRLSKYIL